MQTTLSIPAARQTPPRAWAPRSSLFEPWVAAVATFAVMAWFATGLALLLGEWHGLPKAVATHPAAALQATAKPTRPGPTGLLLI